MTTINKNLNRRQSLDGYYSQLKSKYYRNDFLKPTENIFTELETKTKEGKSELKLIKAENKSYCIFQAMLLILSIFVISFHSICNGNTEISFLKNGQVIQNYTFPHKAVITISIGYSTRYASIISIAACLLIYSIISKKIYWSFPLLILFAMDVIRDITSTLITVYRLFGNMAFENAFTHASIIFFIIMGEIWIFKGVFQLCYYQTNKD